MSNQLSLSKAKSIIDHETWRQEDQDLLEEAVSAEQSLQAAVKKRAREIQLARTFRLRNKSLTNKQFWSLARKTMKKRGTLSAVADKDGNIITDEQLITDMVITDLAKIYCGQKSAIFTSRNEQLVKEVLVKEQTNYEKWSPKEREENEYEEEVCAPTTLDEINALINLHKDERAPGVDGLLATMLKSSSVMFKSKLTDLVNEMLTSGEVATSLQTGRMTLIDKKEPSLEITKKRTLTVSSIILSIITKLVHKRMSSVCEREGFLGAAQYGFRRQRSTTDCVFLLLAAIRRAKRNHRSLSIAFCDLAKAYDSVCRELLYTKLINVGFGGKVVRLIRSMYYNDNIQVNLMSGLSPPIWFTKGVKQGCCLSPLLFSLYISGLGKVLQDTNLGVQLGTEIITALFFADGGVLEH